MTSSAPVFLIKDGALSWPEVAPMRERIYPPEKLINTPVHGIEWAHAQRRVLLFVDDELCAVAGIHEREILCENRKLRIAGIGGVMTEPKLQGHGYGKQIMSYVMAHLSAEARCAFGLLFCEDHNIEFYSKLGWSVFEGDMLVEQHGKTGAFAFRNVMLFPLTQPTKLNGKLDLCGLPW